MQTDFDWLACTVASTPGGEDVQSFPNDPTPRYFFLSYDLMRVFGGYCKPGSNIEKVIIHRLHSRFSVRFRTNGDPFRFEHAVWADGI